VVRYVDLRLGRSRVRCSRILVALRERLDTIREDLACLGTHECVELIFLILGVLCCLCIALLGLFLGAEDAIRHVYIACCQPLSEQVPAVQVTGVIR